MPARRQPPTRVVRNSTTTEIVYDQGHKYEKPVLPTAKKMTVGAALARALRRGAGVKG